MALSSLPTLPTTATTATTASTADIHVSKCPSSSRLSTRRHLFAMPTAAGSPFYSPDATQLVADEHFVFIVFTIAASTAIDESLQHQRQSS